MWWERAELSFHRIQVCAAAIPTLDKVSSSLKVMLAYASERTLPGLLTQIGLQGQVCN